MLINMGTFSLITVQPHSGIQYSCEKCVLGLARPRVVLKGYKCSPWNLMARSSLLGTYIMVEGENQHHKVVL